MWSFQSKICIGPVSRIVRATSMSGLTSWDYKWGIYRSRSHLCPYIDCEYCTSKWRSSCTWEKITFGYYKIFWKCINYFLFPFFLGISLTLTKTFGWETRKQCHFNSIFKVSLQHLKNLFFINYFLWYVNSMCLHCTDLSVLHWEYWDTFGTTRNSVLRFIRNFFLLNSCR